jgi:hypothetical protein
MPSVSKKQHNFMEAIAHNKAFAKKVGVPQSVGQDFSNADKGKKFSKGGDTMASKMNPGFMAMMAKKKTMQEGSKADMASDKKQMMGMKKGGAMKKMASGGMTSMGKVKTNSGNINGVAEKGKTKGTVIKMSGSTPLGMKKGGMTKRMNMGGKAC